MKGGLLVVSALLYVAQQQLETLLQMKLENHITVRIMEKALELEVQYFEDDDLYDKLQRANEESSYRPYQVFSQMVAIGNQSVTLISVVAVLFLWNWWLAVLILLAPLPSLISQTFYSHQGYVIERERSPQYRRLSYLQYLATNNRSVKEIRFLNLRDYILDQYQRLYNHFYKVDSDLVKRETKALVPLTVLSIAASVGAQIYAIVITIRRGNIGFLAGYMEAIVVVQDAVESLIWGVSRLYENNLFVGNLFEFLDLTPHEIRSGRRPVPKKLQTGIEFRGVSFRYPGTSKMVLEDLNLLLHAGQCVAVVGHNGAGKTTLVKLLARLYEPTEGQILLDGLPLVEYDTLDLRKHISTMFQDFVKYEMTARENVGLGLVEELANQERIEDAARRSGAASIIERLPKQYDTTLGRMFEQGHELSAGEWQKVALARVLMRGASIVILDEPTAAIDAEAESELFNQLRRVVAGATTLLVAHRFSTVRMADRIIVMEDGKVIEDGTHEALMGANGTYAHLFRIQAAGYL